MNEHLHPDKHQGRIEANDGWAMEWCLGQRGYAEIRYLQPNGTELEHVSGEMRWEYIEREQAKFLATHSGQMTLL